MKSNLSVEACPVGTLVRPPAPTDAVILYLPANREPSSDSVAPPRMAPPLTAEHLALRTGATVVCARYRTAFSAALEDVRAAYRYCKSAGPVAVVGERIGAALAAALLLRLRDSGAAPPRCAVLVAALLDMSLEASSVFTNARADATFDVAGLRQQVAPYVAGESLTNPLLSPLYANLHGLPPVQLLVAGTDPLLDDSLAFATRAAQSRVSVDLRVWPDTSDFRPEAIASMADFIAKSTADTADDGPRLVSG